MKSAWLLAALVFAFACDSSRAQQMARPPKELLEQYRRASENTIAEVRRRLRPLLPAEAQRQEARIVVRVQPDSWDLYGLSATVEQDVEYINVPLGLIFLLDYMDSAVVATEVGGLGRADMVAYVSTVTKMIASNSLRAERQERLEELPDFPEFAGISSRRWAQITNQDDYEVFKDLVKLSSFSFIVYHELAHHLLPEAGAAVESLAAETAADKFAIDLAVRADINPMFAFYTFALFGALEEANSEAPDNATHPLAVCRALNFALNGKAALEKEPELVEQLKAHGMWAQWSRSPQAIRKVLEEDGVTCPNIEPTLLASEKIPADRAGRSIPSHELELVAWRPVPGTCSGFRATLHIDGENIALLDNTRNSDPVEVGELKEGEHEFSLKDVVGLCIGTEEPFRMRRFLSDGECSGSFQVRNGGQLNLSATVAGPGHDLVCSIRQ